MTETQSFREDTKPLLRPHQLDEMREEERRLESMLEAPPHIANTMQDRGAAVRQLRRLRHQIRTQEPTPYAGGEKDAAVRREAELREQILEGMPTQEEMRRNPPGAVDKHRRWQRANKHRIAEWKNIQLRLHAAGDASVAGERDIANFEVHRPSGGAQQLNMHNEQVQGRDFHNLDGGGTVILAKDEIAALRRESPDLVKQLCVMTPDQRRQAKEIARALMEGTGAEPASTEAESRSRGRRRGQAGGGGASSRPSSARRSELREGGSSGLRTGEGGPKTEIAELRKRAKAVGVNSFGKSKDTLRAEIAEAETKEGGE